MCLKRIAPWADYNGDGKVSFVEYMMYVDARDRIFKLNDHAPKDTSDDDEDYDFDDIFNLDDDEDDVDDYKDDDDKDDFYDEDKDSWKKERFAEAMEYGLDIYGYDTEEKFDEALECDKLRTTHPGTVTQENNFEKQKHISRITDEDIYAKLRLEILGLERSLAKVRKQVTWL